MSERAAKEAQWLRDNEAFRDACSQLHQHYAAEWRAAETPEQRELFYHRDAALTAVETELNRVVGNGTFEKTQQDRAARRAES